MTNDFFMRVTKGAGTGVALGCACGKEEKKDDKRFLDNASAAVFNFPAMCPAECSELNVPQKRRDI